MSTWHQHFRSEIIRPTLQGMTAVVKLSPEAEELLVFTWAHETLGGYFLRQHPTGPGTGVYSIEPTTHDDVWRFIRQMNYSPRLPYPFKLEDRALIYNLEYATMIARLKYLMSPEPLPKATDPMGMATYWWKFYNGSEIDHRIQAIQHYMAVLKK